MPGKLYVVGTPIGNLGDLSPRALDVLNRVDFIAAEDTRVTLKLLNHFGLKKTLISYYEHNKLDKGAAILARIAAGESCALVTDAGMPCISDPGQELVDAAQTAGLPVESVPGPSAVITALALSGLACGRFTFEGFLSVNKPSRKEHLNELRHERRTMVFYEAPHKLKATLRDFLDTFGDRPLALVKELTKLHEQVRRTTLREAVAYYETNEPRGEYVLILSGEPREAEVYTLEQAVDLALRQIENGMKPSEAARETALATSLKKGDIYKAILQYKEETP